MKKKHIIFIVENNTVPLDIRVWREARSATKAGYRVSIIAPTHEEYSKRHEVIDGIEIYRHPNFNHEGEMRYQVLEYINAFFWETHLSIRIFVKNRFHIIHAANPPDIIFLIGILFKPLGVKFIFDHHDLSPELYISKFEGSRNSIFRMLRLLEKLSCKSADIVVGTNDSFKKHVIETHRLRPEKVFVVRNDPELDFLSKMGDDKNEKAKKKIKLLYVGAINAQDGVDILIQIINILVTEFDTKDLKCTIIGDGHALKRVRELVSELNLQSYVEFTNYINDRQLVWRYMNESDICLETAPYNEGNRRSTFIKIMEYMACGKPIVAFDLDETRASAGESAILVKPGDLYGFASAVQELISDPSKRQRLGTMAQARIRNRLNWEHSANRLEDIYRSLLEEP